MLFVINYKLNNLLTVSVRQAFSAICLHNVFKYNTLSISSSVMVNECNLSLSWRQSNAKARGLSVMSITKRMAFKDINLICLNDLFVLGDLALLKPLERFLHTSMVSENKYNIKLSPRPLRLSVNSVTSQREMKLRFDDTK